ncbi:MAG TPA: hypothetical protein VF131_25585 [Blastocatellia bacterium]|nr:hypothetical protein [Blastocatellia bacterium]
MNANNEKGFSLLELMVAAVLTVGLIGGIFALVNRNQQVFVTESGVTDMNQNVRTAVDLVTRDIQCAGVGLPAGFGKGNFAALYYKNGANGSPDSIMMINGDPSAPFATVAGMSTPNTEILLHVPADVVRTGSGSSAQFTYTSYDKKTKPIYKIYSSDPRMYLIYNETNAMLFPLRSNGALTGAGADERIRLQYDGSKFKSPATLFGTTVGLGEPDYSQELNVAVVQSAVAYRLDTTTGELLRSEDFTNWYAVARGIIDFQVRYRILRRTQGGAIEEAITDAPGDGVDKGPSGEPTSRRDIHSLVITIIAETPDVPANNPSYRRFTQKFEVAPRNLNLANNNNIRST